MSEVPAAAAGSHSCVGRVMEKKLLEMGIERVGDLGRLEEGDLEQRFGKWGMRWRAKLVVRMRRMFDSEVGKTPIPNPSATSILTTKTRAVWSAPVHPDAAERDVGRRLREGGYFARTIQLKLRYKDFTTSAAPTRSSRRRNSTPKSTRQCPAVPANWKQARRSDCWASSLEFEAGPSQIDLLEPSRQQRWQKALQAADHLRDKFGDRASG